MPPRRTPARKFEREELVAYIHGINPDCEVAHIVVHKQGATVKFSGALGKHQISDKNKADLDAWILEAAAVWNLDDAIGIPRGWNIAETLEKVEMLNNKAEERKKVLAASEPQC